MIFYTNNNLSKQQIDFSKISSSYALDLTKEDSYIIFDIRNIEISKDNIYNVYNKDFEELVEPTFEASSSVQEDLPETPNTSESDSVLSSLSEESPEIISDKLMTRDVIVTLRIENGEGTDSSQFSSVFPYERI